MTVKGIDGASSYVEKRSLERLSLIREALTALGEAAVRVCVSRTRDGAWNDRTGNLRSSVGFVLCENGRVVAEGGFKTVLQGSAGAERGRMFARGLASSRKSGYSLVVVAGESYSEHVEAIDGKDVLTSAERYVERRLPVLIRRLNEMAGRR